MHVKDQYAIPMTVALPRVVYASRCYYRITMHPYLKNCCSPITVPYSHSGASCPVLVGISVLWH